MKEYKSSESRLKRLFKKGRDKWREKALERQEKLRRYEVKIRDLSESRDKWKEKTKELELRVKELEKEKKAEVREKEGREKKEELEKKDGKEVGGVKQEDMEARAKGHMYPLYVMMLGIEQLVESLTSLRGSSKTFGIFAKYFGVPVPSYTSMRSWQLRVGLYLLNQKAEKRSDWIFIIDHTVELGQSKCLIMLGIKGEELKEGEYEVAHKDVEVLGVEIVAQSTGEIVAEKLTNLAEKVGTPKQIVADHGSDIKKGIELYQAQEPTVIYTYDVTHKMAALLKTQLKDDETWKCFLKACGTHSSTLQQSALYFLAPPRQRTKARYSSVALQIRWAQRILAYQQVGDYTQIDATFSLDKRTLTTVQESFGPQVVEALNTIQQTHFNSRDDFVQALITHIGPERFRHIEAVICPAADMGRRKFDAKLAWVADYRDSLPRYAQMVDIVELLQTQLKHHGLNRLSRRQFRLGLAHFELLPALRPFVVHIYRYLADETRVLSQTKPSPPQPSLLATSDVIESIIGKYKLFSAQRTIHDIGSLVLTIPLFTTQLSTDLIQNAMESVKALDVSQWALNLFGPSTLSKRRSLPSPPTIETPILHELTG